MSDHQPETRQAAAAMARIMRTAANRIRQDGYTPRPGYDGETGHSAASALCHAARCDGTSVGGIHVVTCGQVQARVAGYLYLTGRAGTRAPGHMPAAITTWEDGERRQARTVLAVLDNAAETLSPWRGLRCGACGHFAEGRTAAARKTDMLDHLRGHAVTYGLPVKPECPGCPGRGTGICCCVCNGWIPPAKRRYPGDPSELIPAASDRAPAL